MGDAITIIDVNTPFFAGRNKLQNFCFTDKSVVGGQSKH